MFHNLHAFLCAVIKVLIAPEDMSDVIMYIPATRQVIEHVCCT